jgi:type I restriction enzyme M protein
MDMFLAFEESEYSKIFPNSAFGYWKVTVVNGTDKDTEQIPLDYPGGIDAFIKKEVLPYTPKAKVDPKKTQIGYEISFTKHFYKPVQLRELSEIVADIRALERETEGLLEEVLS